MHHIFADTPETEDWLAYLDTVPTQDADRITIPSPGIWREWLDFVEVPAEDIQDVIATTPSPDKSPELYRVLQKGAAGLLAGMGEIDSPPRFAALRDFNDPELRYFYVQLLAACLPSVRGYHKSLGIPDEISQSTLADLGRNIRVHKKREGLGGLGVMWWLMLHFRGMIYQLGRLQFEMRHAGDAIAASMREHGVEATASTNVLSVHIPDFMGPMDHDACSESIRQAVKFFPRYFPEWPVEYAICDSWLLDPQLAGFLRPESNIVRFQQRFTLSERSYNSDESVMQFVFGKHKADAEIITPRSSLERGVIAHLLSGGEFAGRSGWFRLRD